MKREQENTMSILAASMAGLTAAALLALGAIGVLSEAHRAPDQP